MNTPTPGCLRWGHHYNPNTHHCNRCGEPGLAVFVDNDGMEWTPLEETGPRTDTDNMLVIGETETFHIYDDVNEDPFACPECGCCEWKEFKTNPTNASAMSGVYYCAKCGYVD